MHSCRNFVKSKPLRYLVYLSSIGLKKIFRVAFLNTISYGHQFGGLDIHFCTDFMLLTFDRFTAISAYEYRVVQHSYGYDDVSYLIKLRACICAYACAHDCKYVHICMHAYM